MGCRDIGISKFECLCGEGSIPFGGIPLLVGVFKQVLLNKSMSVTLIHLVYIYFSPLALLIYNLNI